MAKRNNKRKARKSQYRAPENEINPAELNSIYRIVSGKLIDDFVVRSADVSKENTQAKFHEVDLPIRMANNFTTEIITEEMVQRVLAPVLWMIRDGKFDRTSKTYGLKENGNG